MTDNRKSLAAFGDAIFAGEVNTSATINFAMIVESYQNAYGNIYVNTTDVFEAQYAPAIASLLASVTWASPP